MKRKDFFFQCGMVCIGGSGVATLLSGCNIGMIANGEISGSDLLVPIAEFYLKGGNKTQFKKHVIISNDKLNYPICIYRHDQNSYPALWMRCTHQ